MNSVEALDFALRILRNRQRRLATEDGPTSEAIETLSALRELIHDNYPAEPPCAGCDRPRSEHHLGHVYYTTPDEHAKTE